MRLIVLLFFLFISVLVSAQIPAIPDSATNINTDFHFQLTTVSQNHLYFRAPYTDDNSLLKDEKPATTLTSTFFWGAQLGKAFEFYVNPEIAGGAGISSAKGIAGFTNGEAFRVGNPTPTIYIARIYLKHTFNLGGESDYFGTSANQVIKTRTKKYFEITAGKFSIADFFDRNTYSHDPRSQFLNWSLMSAGGWDYPANVRGYTWGVVLEYGQPTWAARTTAVMVPQDANGNDMDLNIGQARSHALEFEKPFMLGKNKGTARLLGFYTLANMGSYRQAVSTQPLSPDITSVRAVARTKYGVALNIEQSLGKTSGLFARASWNDGRNETWAFTEIDQSVSIGFVEKKGVLKKYSDELGIATVINGISNDHRNYLAAGGYGFIIGDGQLNYGNEWITEFYYKINLFYAGFWLTPDYQFVLNPAYNKDRGPAHVFSIRAHIEL
ncbi:MAG: carbohydrate porin [Cyclobacteriaceae bacterium]|nr:carbohydrate porin [Cyclobacteriaceae bacterium]